MRSSAVVPVLMSALIIGGCASSRSAVNGGTIGGVLGAGVGAVVGNQLGDSATGAVIGGTFGAVSGVVIAEPLGSRTKKLKARAKILKLHEQEIAENERLIQELKTHGAKVASTRRGLLVNLSDVLFESGTAALTGVSSSDGLKAVQQIASTIIRHKTPGKILIEGHTDSSGAAKKNRILSFNRALAVARILIEAGIQPERIHVNGLGEARPISSNSDEIGRQENRRVEVLLVPSHS